ncbi:MAG: transposase [Coriobacteriia bacterium]|nr:transposase [Coriobacteriia bacterium]
MCVSSILALGRHTISGMLCASGRQFQDWSGAYRLFEQERIDTSALFAPALAKVADMQPDDGYLFTMLDDTLIRKRGTSVSGTAWKRDPLGPVFHTNFVWGQRFMQLSAALPDPDGSGSARAIPIDLIHTPSPKKPKRSSAPEEWDEYRRAKEASKVSTVAHDRLHLLRAQLPDKRIVCAVDGGYTNRTVFANIPDNTVLIGRIRKDARLFGVPEHSDAPGRGRKRVYGEALPTPEQIRQDDSIPWQTVKAFAAGRHHDFDVKVIDPVRWRGSGSTDVMVVIVRPLGYRRSQNSRMLYRQPAYLICTDPELPLEKLLQAYLWRWEIELNFRDEKTVFGVGEAQVRTAAVVGSVPALIVASYAYLLLAGSSVSERTTELPSPKWHRRKPHSRCSTQQMISLFRSELWGLGIDSIYMRSLPSNDSTRTQFNSQRLTNSLESAVCYAIK